MEVDYVPTARAGDFLGSVTTPGEMWITKDGIMHVKGAEGAGILSGDMPGLWNLH